MAAGGADLRLPSADGTRSPDSDGWKELFWAIFDRSENGMALLDTNQRLLAVNDALVELSTLGRDNLVGASVLQLFPESEREAAESAWEEVLVTGEGKGSRTLLRRELPALEIEWAARRAEIYGKTLILAVVIGGRPLVPRLEAPGRVGKLSPREREVVTLLALGLDTSDVADRLVVAPNTVKSHVRKAMSKLGAHTRAQLVASAMASGEISPVGHRLGAIEAGAAPVARRARVDGGSPNRR